jgi:hypothetical protein
MQSLPRANFVQVSVAFEAGESLRHKARLSSSVTMSLSNQSMQFLNTFRAVANDWQAVLSNSVKARIYLVLRRHVIF